MAESLKNKIAYMTSGNVAFNKKIMGLKKSFDEVNRLLQTPDKKERKK